MRQVDPSYREAASFLLAKRNGQALKMMSWSLRNGYTAEFFEPKDR